MPYQPVTVQPSQGGDLITRYSQENVSAANYVLKRDWRRVTDGEIRREGHIGFAPNGGADATAQSHPAAGEINLIHYSRRPNGQSAVIVGTRDSLYRYFSFDDGNTFAVGVYDVGVYEDLSSIWLRIGHNFGAQLTTADQGHRWEAVDVAGKTVFNNGYDLPVVYDPGWLQVEPLTELREQGIAFVGTVGEFDGMLQLADVAELTPDGLTAVMAGRTGTGNASQTSNLVTAVSNNFTLADVGSSIIFSSGLKATITAWITNKVVTVDAVQVQSATTFRVALLYGAVTDPTTYSRTQYRIMWSDIGDPTSFGLAIGAAATAGLFTGTLTFPSFALQAGSQVVLTGAGLNGAALITTLLNIDRYNGNFVLADKVLTTVTKTTSILQKYSSVASLSGNTDLQDDGSAILRVIDLQNRLIVLKGTTMFIGTFTGDATNPITFQKIYSGPSCIYWKWMLVKLNGTSLLYAGRNGFYTFDLSSLIPKEHAKLSLCQNVFFDQATSTTAMDTSWAATNEVTNEIWFGFASVTSDYVIAYDYRYNTCSTIGFRYTAAATVNKPDSNLFTGDKLNWFLTGTHDGYIMQYSLTDIAAGAWQRASSNYDSIVKSGLISYGDDFGEKDLRSYVIYFGTNEGNPDTEITVLGSRNASETPSTLFTKTLTGPVARNLISTYFRKNFFQDQIRVTGSSLNTKVVRRLFEIIPIDSKSTIRIS